MTTGTVKDLLAVRDETPFGMDREVAWARKAYAVLLQAVLTTTPESVQHRFPRLSKGRINQHAAIDWWTKVHSFLAKLSPKQRREINRTTVTW